MAWPVSEVALWFCHPLQPCDNSSPALPLTCCSQFCLFLALEASRDWWTRWTRRCLYCFSHYRQLLTHGRNICFKRKIFFFVWGGTGRSDSGSPETLHSLPPRCRVQQTATLGANAVTLKRDSVDPLNPGWGGRDDCYRNGDGLYCQKCPAGTYLAEECKEQNSFGRCEPCGDGEFMEYPNAFQSCQECSKCREDQVQQSPCQPTRNTVCVCKDGTFCPPEHPCEMCQKCQPRCPEGQIVLKPCTPDSDLQCGPATDTGTFSVGATIGVIIGISVFLLVTGFCIWKRHCRSSGDGRPSRKSPYEMSSMFQKLKYKNVNVGARDNAANEPRDIETEPPVTLPSVSARPRRNLVPAPGKDPTQVLRGSFYTFAGNVPRENWKKFGRYLNLEENVVVTATSEDGVYDMLLKWQSREGTKASVNTLLEILDELHLGGVAEHISSTLIQKELFQDGAAGSGEHLPPSSCSH
ncbi:tumor necrosis factor receptor superfamily member 10B-like isoform X2 [Cinclus cinclus]|uniref:tumor necrosis factor receptor superfamily member 10B-like isoform X2 n=1 Tax=Cinclus cinclus TaxID=127875 RepID=UPI002E111A7A